MFQKSHPFDFRMPLLHSDWASEARQRDPQQPALAQQQQQPSPATAAPTTTAMPPSPHHPVPPSSPTRRALLPLPLPPWQRLRRTLSPDPLTYVHALGPLAPTALPSALQPLHRPGSSHSPGSLCRPHLTLCGLWLADLPTDRAGTLLPTDAAQCYLSLGSVKCVPRSGASERSPCHYVAHVCLFDGAHFHGNVQAVLPRRVKVGRHGDTWSFDSTAPLLVRCPRERLETMRVCMELCVSHELQPDEAQRLPRLPALAARQVDEVCVAWALVSLAMLPSLHAARSLRVPLCGGPLKHGHTLQEYAAVAATAAAAAGHQSGAPAGQQHAGGCSHGTSLSIRLSPVPATNAAAPLLPVAAIASLPVALAAGLYRQLLAEAVGTPEGLAAVAPVADPVLASFPEILDDPELSAACFRLWSQKQVAAAGPKAAPTPGAAARGLRASFQQCVTAVWTAAGAQAVPPPSIANHPTRRVERQALLERFFQQHPVVSLSRAAHAWLHKPFEAEELCCGPLQQLGATV